MLTSFMDTSMDRVQIPAPLMLSLAMWFAWTRGNMGINDSILVMSLELSKLYASDHPLEISNIRLEKNTVR